MKQVISTEKNPIKIWTHDIEEEAIQQLKNVANLPFIHKHVAVMPDAHHGKGSTVGAVIATHGAIIPAAIGVDIGCGMLACNLGCNINQFKDLHILRHSLERGVPVGFNQHKSLDKLSGSNLCADIKQLYAEKSELSSKNQEKSQLQIGTLGGGNHFIELCYDENMSAWLVLHSGSRNIGKTLAESHIQNAKGVMKQYFIDLPDPDLSYFSQGTTYFNSYIEDLLWAQKYAKLNRALMFSLISEQIERHIGSAINKTNYIDCHHNYCQMENHFGKNVWITRKGAVSAREGELAIIPGSMGTCTYICTGLGNPESFYSCSHGAGRKMSRKKARETFSTEDLAKQTEGVECRKDSDIVDEIPSAYKDLETVMNNQSDLVAVLHKLKPVLCIKG